MTNPRYPATRMRRNRQFAWSRRLVQENRVSVDDLIWPVFVQEGEGRATEVGTMPGVRRYSIDRLIEAVDEAAQLGIPAVAIFPETNPDLKTDDAREALNPDNLVCRAVRAVKQQIPDIGIICDVALDPYSRHGHDGLVIDGRVANDETLEVLARQAVLQAEAGCDVVAPSDMMDGRVEAIRSALDSAGHQQTLILSYAAKYASAFYGPFRDAIGSGKNLAGSSKATYQMDPANLLEAFREVELDIAEGADLLMVKPGLPYLDVIAQVKLRFGMPTFAYQVSGEYAMLVAAAQQNWIDRRRAVAESLLSFRRAGCDAVLTYFAVEAAREIKRGDL